MTSKMSDCIYSGRKLESLQKSGLKTCAGALPLGVAACFAFRLSLDALAKRLLLLAAFCAFGQQSLLWIMDFSKNGPAAGKGKAVCAFYKIKGIPWVHEKKNKKCLRQCFSQNGFKSAQEKQTGLMHNTWAEYFIILLSWEKSFYLTEPKKTWFHVPIQPGMTQYI